MKVSKLYEYCMLAEKTNNQPRYAGILQHPYYCKVFFSDNLLLACVAGARKGKGEGKIGRTS